ALRLRRSFSLCAVLRTNLCVRAPPNRVMAARSLGGQVHALTLSRDGCGRCDGHHKIVDWVENEPRGWPFPCTCVVQYHSRKWKLHRRYNPDNAFVTGLCY